MNQSDLNYLCGIIGGMCGIPTRLYKSGKPVFIHNAVDLPADPIVLCKDEIMAVTGHVGYYVTPDFFYYGIINYKDYKLVIGPARQLYDDQTLSDLAFRLDIPPEKTAQFTAGMKSIISMPLESILQVMIAMNFVLNKEKLGLEDVVIYDEDQERLRQAMEREQLNKTIKQFDAAGDAVQHNTLATEQTIVNIVRKGDVQALDEWAKRAPASNAGIMAMDQLRQVKNTFIVSATLTSRAAIRGGMDVSDALSLSDAYIQKCELLHDPERITNLQYHMVFDYTEQVEKLRAVESPSKLVLDVTAYIRRHLSEPITTEQIAAALFLSRSRLSVKFKQETGQNLIDFILKEKTDEAKRLLRYTDKPAAAISAYLGFSSQSHFSRVFKKYAGCQPNEYRKRFGG